MEEIRHTNVIYVKDISKLGGVETFAYNMAKKYCNFDICVVCKSIHPTQRERLEDYCPVYVHKDQKIYCKTMIINYDTSILDYLEER